MINKWCKLWTTKFQILPRKVV